MRTITTMLVVALLAVPTLACDVWERIEAIPLPSEWAALPHFEHAPLIQVPARIVGKTVYVPLPGEGIDRRCQPEEMRLCRAACGARSLIEYTPNPPTATLQLALANCEVKTVSATLTLLCECEDPSRYTKVNDQKNEEAA
jgi:hypothetical protein